MNLPEVRFRKACRSYCKPIEYSNSIPSAYTLRYR